MSRPTLDRHRKQGRVSAEKDVNGVWQYDLAELGRVYPDKLRLDADGNNVRHAGAKESARADRDGGETPDATLEVKTPPGEQKLLRMQLELEQEERRREREQFEEQIDNLRQTLEKAQEQQTRLTALLTDQRTEKDKHERDRTAQEVRVLKQTVAQLQRQQREKNQGFWERWLGAGGRSKNPARASGRKTVRTN